MRTGTIHLFSLCPYTTNIGDLIAYYINKENTIMSKRKYYYNNNTNKGDELTSPSKFVNFVSNKRYLRVYLCVLLPLMILGYFILDPDLGLITSITYGTLFVNILMYVMFGVIAACLLWLTAVAFTDWKKYGDLELLGEIACKDPVGAGLFAIGINLRWIAIAIVLVGAFFALS